MEVRLLHEHVDGGGVAAVPHTAALVILAPLQHHHAVPALIPRPGQSLVELSTKIHSLPMESVTFTIKIKNL